MPHKPKSRATDLPVISQELLESFGTDPITAEAHQRRIAGLQEGSDQLRALSGEIKHHLGYFPPRAAKPSAVTNQRNGKGATRPS